MRLIASIGREGISPALLQIIPRSSSTARARILQGHEAACLAANGYVELMFAAFRDEDDMPVPQTVADIVYNTALACNLPIQ
jgi:hypothetical protein